MVTFCPKCGSILMPKQERGKTVVVCKCGYRETAGEQAGKITESVKAPKPVSVIEEEVSIHPLVEETCPKCKHGKARFWTLQTRSADEPETRFYQCEKCKHTWREYK